MKSVIDIQADSYQRHEIHGPERIWTETNCYVDVLVELVHALGFDPAAGLAFTLSVDFESDQWTFFKYPTGDLLALYGMDVQEFNPWKNLAENVVNQVNAGNPVLVELDSYYLPDTAGSAYKLEHVKTTVAVNYLDLSNLSMGYFHGQGYYDVSGDDLKNLFQLDGLVHERMLPPYVELVKLRKKPESISEQVLLDVSIETLKRQVALMPEENPFSKFKARFEKDLLWLMEAGMDDFHRYSFATLRQYGACFELAETYINWLNARGVAGLVDTAEKLRRISETSKTFQFQLARSMARKKPLDLATIDMMGDLWSSVRDNLAQITHC